MYGILITTAVYVLANIAYFSVLTSAEILESPAIATVTLLSFPRDFHVRYFQRISVYQVYGDNTDSGISERVTRIY
jgi:hypothetical protein